MKKHNLKVQLNDFGIKPRKGLQYCRKCKQTIPHKAFYKIDIPDGDLCKKHKKKELEKQKKLDSLTKTS